MHLVLSCLLEMLFNLLLEFLYISNLFFNFSSIKTTGQGTIVCTINNNESNIYTWSIDISSILFSKYKESILYLRRNIFS